MTAQDHLRTYIVDAFATGELRGNPAAVVLSTVPLSPTEMAEHAKQLGQPAAGFVWHPHILGDFGVASSDSALPVLRWYGSRGQALPLFNRHATIAATRLLCDLFPHVQHLSYDTLKGPIVANKLPNGYVEVGLPISKQPSQVTDSAEQLRQAVAKACSLESGDIIDFQTARSNSVTDQNLLVALKPDVGLAALRVDTEQLGKLSPRGFYLTQAFAEPHPRYTFKSRVFFPSFLVPEDQSCGSAHTLLAPYWAGKLGIQSHSTEPLLGLHVSANGGEVGCRFDEWRDGATAFLVGTGKIRAV